MRLLPHCPPRHDEAAWASLFQGVEGLITTWGAPRLTPAVLARNTTLRIVGHAAGSVTGIVSGELYQRGVRVVTANEEMAYSVAQWSLMMTQVAARRLTDYAQFGDAGALTWEGADTAVRGLHTSTLGAWGMGAVVRHLVPLLRVLEPAAILVHSDRMTPAHAAELGVTPVSFDELFARCDILHLAESLTRDTLGRVGAAELGSLPDGATLINAGRAALVQESALLDELRRGRIQAILDVHYDEPLPADSPFRGLRNVVMTPHNAGRGRSEFFVPVVLDEFHRHFTGQPLLHEITAGAAARMTDESLMVR
ncbi:MAG: hydroxyacid dehydrogenase [Phycisphaeraceae bacterium]